MENKRTVAEYMGSPPVTISPDQDILDAIRILLQHDISGAPVVAEDGSLLGILTHKDCMKVVLNAAYHSEFYGVVADFMTVDPKVMSPDCSIVEAAQQFLDQSYHRYPVVADGTLVGLISRRDILTALEDAWQWQND